MRYAWKGFSNIVEHIYNPGSYKVTKFVNGVLCFLLQTSIWL